MMLLVVGSGAGPNDLPDIVRDTAPDGAARAAPAMVSDTVPPPGFAVSDSPSAGVSLQAPPTREAAGSLRPPDPSAPRVGSRPRGPERPGDDGHPRSLQKALTMLALAGLSMHPRRRLQGLPESPDDVSRVVSELRWLLADAWNQDIGRKELTRARAVVESLGDRGPLAMARLTDDEVATWIRETRGWLGGFSYQAGSEHLRFLASVMPPEQAVRFGTEVLPHLDDATWESKKAVLADMAGRPDRRSVVAAMIATDPDRARLLNAMAPGGLIAELLEGSQFDARTFTALIESDGLAVATRAEMLLAGASVLAMWVPGQRVPATAAVGHIAAHVDRATIGYLRRHHSAESSNLAPLFEQLIFTDAATDLSEVVGRVAGDPQTYGERWNRADDGRHRLAADMGFLMGVAAEAVVQHAERRSADAEAVARLAKAVLGVTASGVLGPTGSLAVDEIETAYSSSAHRKSHDLRTEFYYLAIPHGEIAGVDPVALAAYHTAFAGVRP